MKCLLEETPLDTGLSTYYCSRCQRITINTSGTGNRSCRRDPCRHRGAELERVPCPSCKGNVQITVFACAIHQKCSVETDVGQAICGACHAYQPV